MRKDGIIFMERKKKKHYFIKFLLSAAVLAGFGAYAFYFPKTMELVDKEITKILAKAGINAEFALFSDFSEFTRKAADKIEYYIEIVEENTKDIKEFDTSPLPVIIFSNAAAFPAENNTVTSGYGSRINPITGEKENHNGIDIAAAYGSDIFAAWPGTVAETGFSKIYGNYVIIEHSKNFFTKYCHLSKIACKKEEFVKAFEKIGEAGSTGQSTGSHLHFEVVVDGIFVDPKECFAL